MKLLVGQLMLAFYSIFDLKHQKNVSFAFDDTISEELVTNLVKAIWIKSCFIRRHWIPYFKRFKVLMLKEPYDYLKYIMYACHLVSDHTPKGFERFLDVYSTVIALIVLFKSQAHDVYVRYSPHIFTAYFDLHLKKHFTNVVAGNVFKHISQTRLRKMLRRIASRKEGLPYEPEKISQYDIDIHEETKFLISWIIESFVNEEFVGGKSSDPVAIAGIENSL
ncbi:hypothetical protein CEXT_301701 [Caerostris extrusa]|uniref:Uncharacterized protein n=1 Tax=Caerostris extrusa TaxID=172846 RepID=A0AAV4S3J1_CAEEX|nr:hypothetical protein CEXT_301701 [Caerostris extrusa]